MLNPFSFPYESKNRQKQGKATTVLQRQNAKTAKQRKFADVLPDIFTFAIAFGVCVVLF